MKENIIKKPNEKTALISSVGADGEQSFQNNRNYIISDTDRKNKVYTELDSENSETYSRIKPLSLETATLTEILETVYPPQLTVIENLFYAGTYLFVGDPKIGKSFFMAQIAYHVATGLPMWDYKVNRGTVLYLALEDDYARIQRRLSQMFGVDGSDSLHFAVHSLTVSIGLETQLENFVADHSDTRLIIIDTLQKVRDSIRDSSYASDYDFMTKLKRFSDRHNVCLLIVHHKRKMESSDPFDMISGTNGLLGAADGAVMLQRENDGTMMNVTGRDQPEQKFTMRFNPTRWYWDFIRVEGRLWKLPEDGLLKGVSSLLSREAPEWRGTATELLARLGRTDMKANSLTRKLNVNVERLFSEYGIIYENRRTHEGRLVILRLTEEQRVDNETSDVDFRGMENTVTADATVTQTEGSDLLEKCADTL